ncbi:MAG: hypothetical protein V3S55_00210, partial [Nitrospiraceae bacterium]
MTKSGFRFVSSVRTGELSMRPVGRRVRYLVVAFAATVLSAGNAHAAPQIVAALPTGGEAELVCAGGN